MELKAPAIGQSAEILTPEALAFIEKLARQFQPTRAQLLAKRVERQKEIDEDATAERNEQKNGQAPDFTISHS